MADILLNISIPLEKYIYVNITGLQEWHTANCSKYEHIDPLKEVLSFSHLKQFLKTNIQIEKDTCHPYNILVRGIACFMEFHARSPPFADLRQLLPSLCKGTERFEMLLGSNCKCMRW